MIALRTSEERWSHDDNVGQEESDYSESEREQNKLTQNMYKVRNVRFIDTKVNKTPCNVMITSMILKRLIISGCKDDNI
jgi:hypothetical protein